MKLLKLATSLLITAALCGCSSTGLGDKVIVKALLLDYQKEYSILVGQVDWAISLLEQYGSDDVVIRKAVELLTAALRDAEDRYIALS